tara:strand:- start:30 stop:1124 length:1095 start_codon:yes stop_codon:yes gene_type:complete
MTTSSEKYNASSAKIQPTTENETQSSTGDTFHKVLINNETFTIRTDIKGAFLGGKNFGHGIHVFENGNINIQTGPKQFGNGKLVTICRGGQIIKSGPTIIERTGYKKSFLQEGEDEKIIAAEETNYGDVIQETIGGTHTIKADNIVIDAQDTLIIKGPGGITIDTQALLKLVAADISEEYVTKTEEGEKLEHKVQERLMTSNDVRSSDNIVISGHINRRIGGDYDMDIGGISATRIQGNKALKGVPLVLNRLYGFHIGLNAPSAGFGGMNITSKTGSVKINAGVDLQLKADALFNISSTVGLGNISTGANLNLKSKTGIAMTSGGLSIPSLVDDDITIKSKNNVVIEAAKDVDIDSQEGKIYLN